MQRPDSRRPRRDGGAARPNSSSSSQNGGRPAGPRTPARRDSFGGNSFGGGKPRRDFGGADDRPRFDRGERNDRPQGSGRDQFAPRDGRPSFRDGGNRDERGGRPSFRDGNRAERGGRPSFGNPRENRGFQPDRFAGNADRPRGDWQPDRDRPAKPKREYGTPHHNFDGSVVPHGRPGERNRKFAKPAASRPESGPRVPGRPTDFRGGERGGFGGEERRPQFDQPKGANWKKPNGNRGFGSDRRDARDRFADNRARDERRTNGWQPEYKFRQEQQGGGEGRSFGGGDRSFDNDYRSDRPRTDRGPVKSGFAGKGPRPTERRFGQDRAEQFSAPTYNLQRYEKGPKGRKNAGRDADEPKEGVRLNRYIANAGVCSRREADSLIAAGEIRVNGEVVREMGYIVKPEDSVQYGKRSLKREKLVYVLLNKPKDYITTTEDPEERKTVMDLVGNASKERIFPVGRLDRNTTGLLLFTNDGELAQKLTHPSHRMQKIYQVELDKPLRLEDFQQIKDGLDLEDGKVEVDDLAVVNGNERFVGIELHSGRNRIVRRIFEHLGYDVVTLDRVQYAGLTKKDLPRGNWRYLSEQEVVRLKYFI